MLIVTSRWRDNLLGKSGAGGAQKFVERGIGQSVARWFETHDGIARAEPQTVARRNGKTAGSQLLRKGLRKRRLDRRKQRAALALRVAARADADEKTNGASVHERA